MGITKPFRRTCRQLADGSYEKSGNGRYVKHPRFAVAPEQYVRAFLLIQKDLQKLFDYVEPADKNLGCYSYRIHELHMRTCIEVEANCKAILTENGYVRSGDLNMGDYKKIEKTHRLSGYQIKAPFWHGTQNVRTPYSAWQSGGALSWYDAYNAAKHDRHNEFVRANLENLLNAVSGLVALLSAQFCREDFSPGDVLLALSGPNDGLESAIGGYFRVKFPDNWPAAERYSFDWQQLETQADPFQTLTF
jgi:hypothetical protein